MNMITLILVRGAFFGLLYFTKIILYLITLLVWILTVATGQLVFIPEMNWLYFVFVLITIGAIYDAWRSRHS